MSEQFEVPPSIRALEEQLQMAADELDATIQQVQQQSFDRGPHVTEEDLRDLSRYAHSREAPQELRDLQRRIERGEFTWEEVLSGEVMHDEGVRAALSANLDDLRDAWVRIEEGEDVDAVLADGPKSEREDEDEGDDDPAGRGGNS
jgi:hypothetical protein